MRFIEVHIQTQYGKFLFKLHPIFATSLRSFENRMKRAVLQGSVGLSQDITVGNMFKQKSSANPEILSCFCSIVAE